MKIFLSSTFEIICKMKQVLKVQETPKKRLGVTSNVRLKRSINITVTAFEEREFF